MKNLRLDDFISRWKAEDSGVTPLLRQRKEAAYDMASDFTRKVTLNNPTSPTDLSPDKEQASSNSKPKRKPPDGTVEYVVQASETLESISAKCDATPSELVKINKLALRMVFPGQHIFVPDKGALPAETAHQLNGTMKEGQRSKATSPTDAPKRSKSNERHLNILGHIEAIIIADGHPQDSQTTVDSATVIPEVEGGRLDEDCHARFLKINASYVIEDQGNVSGVLLVTPNAIMFDPNVSDTLVIKHGSDKYGAIIPLENILSAAIYSEIVPREARRHSKVEPSMFASLLAHRSESLQEESAEKEMDEESVERRDSVEKLPQQEQVVEVKLKEGTHEDHALARRVVSLPVRAMVEETHQQENMDDGRKARLKVGSPPSNEKPEGMLARTRKLSPFRIRSAAEKSSDEDMCTESIGKKRGSLAPLRKLSNSLGLGKKDSQTSLTGDFEEWSKGMDGIFKRTGSLRASVSPKIKSFVDYSSGLFNVENDEATSPKLLPASSEESSPLPGESFTTWQLRRGLSREDVLQHASVRRLKFGYRSVVTMEDKPELFKSVEELLPKEKDMGKPLYLCIRAGVPVGNKSPKGTGATETHSRKRFKPEYWFAIERDKAEKFYGFMLHWRPEAYGTEEMDPAELGFMLFDEPDEELHSHFAKDLRGMAKEWEVIAYDEAKRRAFFLEREESVIPLPEWRGRSDILTDDICRWLLPHLPARAQGYPWTLIYSTSEHGFSLKTLYRRMQSIDASTLFIVKDVNEHIFGAIISCGLRVAEHFYGTGESLLFTLVPEFKVYNWIGNNEYIVRGQLENIAIGSGRGSYGIWLDEDFNKGRTAGCSTFDNEPLCPCGDFLVKNVEAWSFSDFGY